MAYGRGDCSDEKKRVFDNVVFAGCLTTVRHELRDGIQVFELPCLTFVSLLLEGVIEWFCGSPG